MAIERTIPMKLLLWPLLFLTLLWIGCASAPQPIQNEGEVRYKLGVSYLGEADYASALRELVRAAELEPRKAEVHNALGLAYYGLERLEEAEKEFQQALDLDPKFTEAYNNLGATYLKQERWEEAIEAFQKVTVDLTYPRPEVPFTNIGFAYQRQGELIKAIEYYDQAIRYNVKYDLAYLNRGLAYKELRRLDNAANDFQKVVELRPNSAQAYYNLGLVRRDQLEGRKAIEAFQKVVEIGNPQDLVDKAQGEIQLLTR
jgi:tetratricopeptide (TPR) repeat protein